MRILNYVSLFASIILPLFNIPLIIRIVKRKSADDISLVWVFGVWICILLMSPGALTSKDATFYWFGWMNLIFFTGVVFVTVKYHHKFKNQK
ncbi:MAG TPA: hypothetical protein PLL75_03650 [Candidatus Omnitrophota bacterium]|nr:hypothetical protein [Candidatus Omnitrophota bacterium]HPS36803.1 hypothetical protein [Candidatus Omnitrophota bacterium]